MSSFICDGSHYCCNDGLWRLFVVAIMYFAVVFYVFPRCLVKGSRFTLGVWGWRCARGVRNRKRPRAKVVGLNKVWQAWQAWHFVTFHVFQEESVCAQPSWQ